MSTQASSEKLGNIYEPVNLGYQIGGTDQAQKAMEQVSSEHNLDLPQFDPKMESIRATDNLSRINLRAEKGELQDGGIPDSTGILRSMGDVESHGDYVYAFTALRDSISSDESSTLEEQLEILTEKLATYVADGNISFELAERLITFVKFIDEQTKQIEQLKSYITMDVVADLLGNEKKRKRRLNSLQSDIIMGDLSKSSYFKLLELFSPKKPNFNKETGERIVEEPNSQIKQ